LYHSYPSLVVGFHGCDRAIGEKLISGEYGFKSSVNPYDWLGEGMYFWENSWRRAEEWAQSGRMRGTVDDPFVVGAVIDLGHCFNLLDHYHLELLQQGYESLRELLQQDENFEGLLPDNSGGADKLFRELDCAVINFLHEMREDARVPAFDSVRGVFTEGEELYPGAGFKEKNHIQLAVRNPNCIKGFFHPREHNPDYSRV